MATFPIRVFGDPRAQAALPRRHRVRRRAGPPGRRHDRDHVRRSRRRPGRQPDRHPEADLRLRRRRRPLHRRQPHHRRDLGGVGVRGGLPVGARAVLPDRAAPVRHAHGLRPRRPGVHPGGRGPPRPHLPPRDRPPRRLPPPRPPRPRAAQGGHADPPVRRHRRAVSAASASGDGDPCRGRSRSRAVRLVFLGSPPEAQGALRALHDAGHEIALVVTQPDRQPGPGRRPRPEPGQADGHRARACRSSPPSGARKPSTTSPAAAPTSAWWSPSAS